MTDKSTGSSQQSTSAMPDLDWSQVRETVLMLKLAAAQVDYSLNEGGNSINTLTDSFTAMAGSLGAIELAAKELKEKYKVENDAQSFIQAQCGSVSVAMQHAIMAFQFYDKLSQRLDHVVESMSQLADLVGSPERIYSPTEWRGLQDNIRSRYTMSQERELFDAIMNGENPESVFERMHELASADEDDGDIELF
jgi:septation ring formation regulator EzrA